MSIVVGFGTVPRCQVGDVGPAGRLTQEVGVDRPVVTKAARRAVGTHRVEKDGVDGSRKVWPIVEDTTAARGRPGLTAKCRRLHPEDNPVASTHIVTQRAARTIVVLMCWLFSLFEATRHHTCVFAERLGRSPSASAE